MNLILDFLDGLWTKLKARRAAQAAADLARGQEILDQAAQEAAEMERAAKELDQALSTTPNTVPPKP